MTDRLILTVACLLLVAAAEPATQPVLTRVVVEKADKTRLAGKITEYDIEGFVLVNDRDQSHDVKWSEMAAKNVFPLYARLIEKNNDAEEWIALGEMLLGMDEGKVWADRAFTRAVKIDPSQKERVDEIKSSGGTGGKRGPTTRGSGDDVLEDQAHDDMAATPQTVGEVEEKYWGKLTEDEMTQAIASLIEFGDQTRERVNGDLEFFETKFFLFYSDLPNKEARQWAGLLDKMYARLCEMFAVPKETNVWRGKALIFVFREESDYLKFQQVMHRTDARGTAGMCHNYGDGTVHIAFYRQPVELTFAHVLVHESVHGFLHRYRKPNNVPSWANEGLAEVIAAELVPNPQNHEEMHRASRMIIERLGGLDDGFFFGTHIQGYHYPIARTMCQFMIEQDRKRYVEFINGIKDGLEWEESLNQKFGVPRERLVDFYYDWLGVQRALLR